jgi:hypothetical protein
MGISMAIGKPIGIPVALLLDNLLREKTLASKEHSICKLRDRL